MISTKPSTLTCRADNDVTSAPVHVSDLKMPIRGDPIYHRIVNVGIIDGHNWPNKGTIRTGAIFAMIEEVLNVISVYIRLHYHSSTFVRRFDPVELSVNEKKKKNRALMIRFYFDRFVHFYPVKGEMSRVRASRLVLTSLFTFVYPAFHAVKSSLIIWLPAPF